MVSFLRNTQLSTSVCTLTQVQTVITNGLQSGRGWTSVLFSADPRSAKTQTNTTSLLLKEGFPLCHSLPAILSGVSNVIYCLSSAMCGVMNVPRMRSVLKIYFSCPSAAKDTKANMGFTLPSLQRDNYILRH